MGTEGTLLVGDGFGLGLEPGATIVGLCCFRGVSWWKGMGLPLFE